MNQESVLHHIGIVVPDRDAAVSFYTEALPFTVAQTYERKGDGIDQIIGYDNSHLRSAMLHVGSTVMLELIEYVCPAPVPGDNSERALLGASHFAIEVGNIAEAMESIVASGGVAMNPPALISEERLATYLQDPFGNWIELIQDLG